MGKLLVFTRPWQALGAPESSHLITTFALLLSSAAFAAWLITSGGFSSSKSASLVAPMVSELSASENNALAGDLFPGDTGKAYIKAFNPNAVDLYIVGVNSVLGIEAAPPTEADGVAGGGMRGIRRHTCCRSTAGMR